MLPGRRHSQHAPIYISMEKKEEEEEVEESRGWRRVVGDVSGKGDAVVRTLRGG